MPLQFQILICHKYLLNRKGLKLLSYFTISYLDTSESQTNFLFHLTGILIKFYANIQFFAK